MSKDAEMIKMIEIGNIIIQKNKTDQTGLHVGKVVDIVYTVSAPNKVVMKTHKGNIVFSEDSVRKLNI